MEGTIGEIRWFAGTFAPKSWAYCKGQTINIASNTALFSILGTTYGGNGTTTFQLPDFQGRVAVGAGQGPGLSLYTLGQKGGVESETLSAQQLAAHSHAVVISLNATDNDGTTAELNGKNFSTTTSNVYGAAAGSNKLAPFNVTSVTPSGGNAPITIIQPSLGMNYIICQYGVYPARN